MNTYLSPGFAKINCHISTCFVSAHIRKMVSIHAEGKTGNAFRDALRRMSAEHEFQLIVRGLVKLLNNPHQANNTLLPSSMKQIACFQEVLEPLICIMIQLFLHAYFCVAAFPFNSYLYSLKRCRNSSNYQYIHWLAAVHMPFTRDTRATHTLHTCH